MTTMKASLSGISQSLTDKGFRWTKPRQQVLEVFINNHVPLTVAEVHSRLGGGADVASVYRTITLFCKEEVLSFIDTVNESRRYELSDKYREHHHHLICQACGQIEDFEECFIENIEKQIFKKMKFQVTNHDLKFFGRCSKC